MTQRRRTVRSLIRDSKVLIHPWNKLSRSSRVLSSHFHNKVTDKIMNGQMETPNGCVVINYGVVQNDFYLKRDGIRVLNKRENALLASNKFNFFSEVKDKGVNVPNFTDNKEEALELMSLGKDIMMRDKISTGGVDIVFLKEDLSQIKNYNGRTFFTEYVKKKEEYRVHVFCGKIIDVQRKVLRKVNPHTNEPIDSSTIDFRVRSHGNGFIFQREDIKPDDMVLSQAILAVQSIGLDFGAVDVIWNDHYKKAFVLEVNTAPGLEGTTIQNYIEAIENVRDN